MASTTDDGSYKYSVVPVATFTTYRIVVVVVVVAVMLFLFLSLTKLGWFGILIIMPSNGFVI